MANPTSNFGWQMPTNSDLVKDLPADFEVFGQAVDTSMADLKGGTTGQILSKNSNTDMDFTWINNDQGDITNVGVTSPITGGGSSGSVTIGIQDGTTTQKGAVQLENSTSSTSTTTAAVPASVKSAYDLANGAIPKTLTTTTGDLIYASSANTPARLAIGSSNQVLTVSGGVPTWATPAGGGGWTLINTGGTSVNGLTTCTISSIPSTYKSLKILCIGIKRNAASGGVLGLQLNTDTSSAYLYGQKKFSDTSESYAVSTGTTSYEICAQIAQSNGGDMEADVAVIDIDNYTNTTYGKAIAHHASGHQNNWIQQFGSGFYASASAISSISIISSAAMGAGTVYVYGVS